MDDVITFLKIGKKAYTDFTNGGYSYTKEIKALGNFVEQEQFVDVYLEGRGKELAGLDPITFLLEECITYLHHMWSAEGVAVGFINKQVTNGQLLKVLERIKQHLYDGSHEKQ